ncbi:hypothetical protein ES703_96888 [subsurface metagenome]
MEKKCSKCGLTKPLEQFTRDNKGRSGHRAYCKACASKYMAKYYSQQPRGRYHRLRDAASSQRIPFAITANDFIKWWVAQKPICFYCGQTLTNSIYRKHRLSDMTIDRKEPAKGYILSNMVLACRRCNLMKGDWLTVEQTLEIAQRYFKPVVRG